MGNTQPYLLCCVYLLALLPVPFRAAGAQCRCQESTRGDVSGVTPAGTHCHPLTTTSWAWPFGIRGGMSCSCGQSVTRLSSPSLPAAAGRAHPQCHQAHGATAAHRATETATGHVRCHRKPKEGAAEHRQLWLSVCSVLPHHSEGSRELQGKGETLQWSLQH